MSRLAVTAITLDFGNTLVRVDRPGLHAVVDVAARVLVGAGVIADADQFHAIWSEERDRQFREEVPEFREVDLDDRAVRVLARLRGLEPPPDSERWDDDAAARLSEPTEIGAVVEAYSRAFVERMAPVQDASQTLRRLAERGFVLGILSNWPLALTIDRYVEARGWGPYLRAVVVSHRVGTIKPHPAIFRAAEDALGLGPGDRGRILHVGDDWAADVVGSKAAGWRSAFLRDRQADTPLPTSMPGDARRDVEGAGEPDLVLDDLAELDDLVELATTAATPAPAAPATAAE